MTHIARKNIREGFSRRARDRRSMKRTAEDVCAPLLHAEDALLSIVMRQNFDEQAALLFNQQLVQLSVAGDGLKNLALREQFRLRALQALGRLKPKAEKKLAQKARKPSPFPSLKISLPFI